MSQPQPGKPPPHSGTPVRRTGQALLDKGNAAIDRANATRAGAMWARLNAVDFINSAFQFATFAMLCIFPLLVVVAAAAGSDIRKVISTRLGLNPQAAKDVNGLMSSGHQALTSLTVVGSSSWCSRRSRSPPRCRAGTRRSTTSHRHVTGCGS